MFDQVSFDDRYGHAFVLMRLPTFEEPWPPTFRWKQLDPSDGARTVHRRIVENLMNPDWRMLHFLGIEDHPVNLHPDALQRVIESSLDRIHARFVVYKQMDELVLLPPRPVAVPTAPVAATQEQPALLKNGWVGFEVTSEAGMPIASILIELTLPDGSLRTITTDPQGQTLVTGIEPGSCKMTLAKIEASRWKPAGGSLSGTRKETDQTHVVKRGECLAQIARAYGLGDWREVWEHGPNAGVRDARKSPHVLRPGDELVIPGMELGELQCETDVMHAIEVEQHGAMVAVLNGHLVDDPAALKTDWRDGNGTLSSGSSLHKDGDTLATRTKDVPHGASLVLHA